MSRLAIGLESPLQPDVTRLIADLDAYLNGLYAPEANHLLPPEGLAGPDVRFFVARMDGRPVGCMALRIADDYGEVKRMYVAPEARGLGVGRALLQAIEAEARALGLPMLQLETGGDQPEALRLIRAAAFERCGPFGGYPDNGISVFFAKAL